MLELSDQRAHCLAHLLQSQSIDGGNASGSRHVGRCGSGGLIDNALRPNAFLERLKELLSLVAGDLEDLPSLLERLESNIHGWGLEATGALPRLKDISSGSHEILIGSNDGIDDGIHRNWGCSSNWDENFGLEEEFVVV